MFDLWQIPEQTLVPSHLLYFTFKEVFSENIPIEVNVWVARILRFHLSISPWKCAEESIS